MLARMGTVVAELERALQRAWRFDELAVYGDLLQAAGDPRGELVALDLHPNAGDAEWRARRREALNAWLGETLATSAGAVVQHGFVHELRYGCHPPTLLESALGAYVRGYAVWGDSDRIAEALAVLAARPRPWLVRLTIASWSGAPLSSKLADAVIAATPHLAELHLVGAPPFRAFAHPALRLLCLDEAIEAELARGDLEVRRRQSVQRATGWTIAPDDRARLLAAVAEHPNCNHLYATLGETFADPPALLLARAAAAGAIELDGVVARMPAVEPGPVRFVPTKPAGNLVVETASAEVLVGRIDEHGEQIKRCLAEHAMPPDLRAPLVEYLAILQSLADAETRLARQRTLRALGPPLARSLHALVENRGWRGEAGDASWESVEALAAVLAPPGAASRVALRRS